MSAATPNTSGDAKTDDFPPLVRLAAAAACRNWLTSRTSLEGVPADLSKLVWKECCLRSRT